MELPDEIQEVRVLRVQPGDRLILTSPVRLTAPDVKRIREQFAGRYPDNEVILFDGGADLHILRKDEPDA
jgi:hypothetical protein